MSAIVTLTFNPALDKSITVPRLLPEKKLKCSLPVYGPGGGGINVARAIKKLGGSAIAAYLAGGHVGHQISSLLTREGIKSLVTETQCSTRENLIVFDNATGRQYLFDMQCEGINHWEAEECLQHLGQLQDVGYIVVSGSLPPGLPDDIFTKLADIARQKQARLIVDTSGEALKKALQAGVYLIKPNLRELASLTGKEELAVEMAECAAREVLCSSNCEVIVVSLGAAGALLVTKEFVASFSPPVSLVKSTVGAGDSLVAGIVFSLAENKSLAEAVRYGVACGCAATLNPGTELCIKADADQLYPAIGVKGCTPLVK